MNRHASMTIALTAALALSLAGCAYPGIEQDRAAAAAGQVETAADAPHQGTPGTPQGHSPDTGQPSIGHEGDEPSVGHEDDTEKTLREQAEDIVEDAKGAAADAARTRLNLEPHTGSAVVYAAARQEWSPKLWTVSWDKDGQTLLWKTMDCTGKVLDEVGGSVEDGADRITVTWDGKDPTSVASRSPDTRFTVGATGVPQLSHPTAPPFTGDLEAATSEFGSMCGVLVEAVVG